jgi:hypothetical protein
MAEDKPNVTMRIRVGSAELEVTGPADFVEKKIEEFQKSIKEIIPVGPIPIGSDATASQGLATATKGLSANQFFKKMSLKTDIDRVLALGYFLENMKGQQNFTRAEIMGAFQEAKVTLPKNISDAISQNIKKGFIMAAGNKDNKTAYVLTTDGEEAIVSMMLPK